MRTVGQILKEARTDNFYTLEDIEKNTKIRLELLEALERDDYNSLPPEIFVRGFIKNYGQFLKLDTSKLLAIFRRDYEKKKHPPEVMESFSKPITKNNFIITPQRILSLVIVLVIFGFFAYLWVEYRQFVGSPPLNIASPIDGQTVEIPSVVVEGTTDPDAKVSVNNQEIGVADNGHFREEIKLSASSNTITVTSTSRFGQQSKIDRQVFVKK